MIISKEKIIYNKILENTNPETLKVLRANSLINLFAQRVIETLNDENKQNGLKRLMPDISWLSGRCFDLF